MAFYTWSQTAGSNASADGTINWAEGQAPSSVNDSARAVMARLREWGNDIAGNITTGGTATAYTVTTNQVFDSLAHLNGQVIAFVPHATNTNTVGNDVTLNVDSLGAKPIRSQPSVALPNGSLILGTPYVAVYNSSDAVFYLRGMTNPYAIPLAGGLDYWGTSTPNSSFAFPAGQAISRTTYATLFAIMGTTYGSGDGSTTFNLPDKTGRVSAMKESSATRLTSTYFVGDSTAMGAVGGSDRNSVILTHNHNITDTGHAHTELIDGPGGSPNRAISGSGNGSGNVSGGNTASATTGITINNAGSASAHNIVQPTIICNYIIRVI